MWMFSSKACLLAYKKLDGTDNKAEVTSKYSGQLTVVTNNEHTLIADNKIVWCDSWIWIAMTSLPICDRTHYGKILT